MSTQDNVAVHANVIREAAQKEPRHLECCSACESAVTAQPTILQSRILLVIAAVLIALVAVTTVALTPEDAYANITGPTRLDNGQGNVEWLIEDDGTLVIRPRNGADFGRIAGTNSSYADNNNWPWRSFASRITAIWVDGTVGTMPDTRLANMFNGLSSATTADVSGFDFTTDGDGNQVAGRGTVTSLASFFQNCSSLTEITGLEQLSSVNNTNTSNMFNGCSNLTKIEGIGSLNMNNVQDMSSMFRRCSSLTELDLSSWTNNGKVYNMQSMFSSTTSLKKLILNNPDFKTRSYNSGGCMYQGMFGNSGDGGNYRCPSLEYVDMSNITLTGRKGPSGDPDVNQEQAMFRDLPSLTTVKMHDTKFNDWHSFNEMFARCPKLTTVEMTGDMGDLGTLTHMESMFQGSFTEPGPNSKLDLSGIGTLRDITAMSFLVDGCTGLETLIIDNMDNSCMGDFGPSGYGIRYANLGIKTLENLKVLSAKRTKVYMVGNEMNGHNKPYDNISNSDDVAFFEQGYFHLDADSGESGDFSAHQIIDMIANVNDHGVSDINDIALLPAGVYTRTDKKEYEFKDVPKTYYAIDSMEGVLPIVEIQSGPDSWTPVTSGGRYDNGKWVIETTEYDAGGIYYRVYTRNDLTERQNDIDYDGAPIRVTYPKAATDINGKKHDVVVTFNDFRFTNNDRIPDTTNAFVDEYGNPIPGRPVAGETIPLGPNDPYRRYVLLIGPTRNGVSNLQLRNYLQANNGVGVLSRGAGTEADFTISIKDALPDTSVLFYMRDLDVEDKQDWKQGATPQDDVLLGRTYNEHSEGITLGTGNDTNTLTFANATGLKTYDVQDAAGNKFVHVGGTAPDPATPWSSFYVRANAQSANYTWTSGIACDTVLLNQTTVTPPKPVYIIPEALKTVNGTTPAGEYADWFEFTLEPATEIETMPYTYFWMENGQRKEATVDLPNEADVKEMINNDVGVVPFTELKFLTPLSTNMAEEQVPPDVSELTFAYWLRQNIASTWGDRTFNRILDTNRANLEQLLINEGIVSRTNVGAFLQKVDDDLQAALVAAKTHPQETGTFDPHAYNEHIARGYVYKISEYDPNDPQDSVTYNTENVIYFMRIIVSDPKNDLEMEKGTKAEVTIGKYHFDPDAPTAPIDPANIQWDEENTRTIWSSDAQPVIGSGGVPIKRNNSTVFTDGSGKKFYREGGKFLSYDTHQELKPATSEQVAWKVEYDANNDGVIDENTEMFPVSVDRNGVEYIKVVDEQSGKISYLDPNNDFKVLLESKTGDIYPSEDDGHLAEEQTNSSGQKIREDVHGQSYVVDNGEYIDPDTGQTLDVEDGIFNPDDTTDRLIYKNKKATYQGQEYEIRIDSSGVTYIKVGDNYFTPEGQPLTVGQIGEVTPSSSDKEATSDKRSPAELIVMDALGNSHIIKKDTHGVQYYEADNQYYSVIGTMLTVTPGVFEPNASDESVTLTYDVRQYGDGNNAQLYYKSEGAYYKLTKVDEDTYQADGTVFDFPADALDTSEAVIVGSFSNRVLTSEISVEKQTIDDKAGEFTFEITFDSDFEPKNYLFDPATQTDASVSPFEKVGERTYRFTLVDGQKLLIRDVPLQTTYTITEPVEANGWELADIKTGDSDSPDYPLETITGTNKVSHRIIKEKTVTVTRAATQADVDEGRATTTGELITVIEPNPDYKGDYDHVFTNRFTELLVKKVHTGGDKDKLFDFTATATLTGLPPLEEFSYGYMDENDNRICKTGIADARGTAVVAFDPFALKGEHADNEGEYDIVLIVPKGAQVVITEEPVQNYTTTWQVDDGAADSVDEEGSTTPISVNDDKMTVTFTNMNILGTFGINTTKFLDGRSFDNAQDKFTFMITAEDGTPMPVKADSNTGALSPDEVVRPADIEAADGKVKAHVDFGTIAYTLEDLNARTVTYKDANDIEKKVIRYWTIEDLTSTEEVMYNSQPVFYEPGVEITPSSALFIPVDASGFVYQKDPNLPWPTELEGIYADDQLFAKPAGAPDNTYYLANLDGTDTPLTQDITYSRTFDMTNEDDRNDFEDDAIVPADKRDAATGEILDNTFTYQIMENPQDSDNGDGRAITNDQRVAEVAVYVLWDPNADNGEGKPKGRIYASAAREDAENPDSAFITNANDANASLYYSSTSDTHYADIDGNPVDFGPMVTTESVFFTNKYDAKNTWTPDVVKTLNGRPLERDQFSFKLKAVGIDDDSDGTVDTNIPDAVVPMPAGNVPAEEQGQAVYSKDDTTYYYVEATESEPAKLVPADGGEAIENPNLDEYTRVMDTTEVDSLLQDVEQDAQASYKGTNDLYGPVDFGKISYTNNDLKKEVTYADAKTDGVAEKVISWTVESDEGKVVYGPIPDDAVAEVVVDGKDAVTVTYAEASDAQRKAAQGTTEKSLWKSADGTTTYIATSTGPVQEDQSGEEGQGSQGGEGGQGGSDGQGSQEGEGGQGSQEGEGSEGSQEGQGGQEGEGGEGSQDGSDGQEGQVGYFAADGTTFVELPADAKGTYYMDKRTFVYKMWEVEGEDDYGVTTYDEHNSEANAYEIHVTVEEGKDGTLTVTPKLSNGTEISETDPITFTNTYEAAGTVNLKANKVLEGRDLKDEEFEFTVTAEDGAPEPSNTTVKNAADGTIDFGTITFTQEHLKPAAQAGGEAPDAYDANRTADGFYEKSFTYTITETPKNENGLTSDPKTITCVITVREDAQGNITVVAVNGNDGNDESLKTSFTVDSPKAAGETWSYNGTDYDSEEDAKAAVDEAKTENPDASYDDIVHTPGFANATSTVIAGEFTNEYNASGTADITATKKLRGGTLVANEFYFELIGNARDEDGQAVADSVLDTQPNAANGTVTFRTIPYNLAQVREDADNGICVYTPAEEEQEATTYTAEEADIYNTENGLEPGDEGYVSEGDEKTPAVEAAPEYWTYTYKVKEVVPAGDGASDKITYDTSEKTITVKVTDAGDGTLDTEVTGADEAIFMNTVKVRDLTVTKVWVDSDGDTITDITPQTRPTSLTLTITANTADAEQAVVLGEDWTPSEDGTTSTMDVELTADDDAADTNQYIWTKTIQNLPRYKADGTTITYTVSEKPENTPSNYVASVVPALNMVVNTYNLQKIEGTKVWVDGNAPHDNSKDLKSKLVVNWKTDDGEGTDESVKTGTVADPHIDWADDGTGKFTIIGLPTQDPETGLTRTYWVSEDAIEGYETSYGDTSTYDADEDDEADGITNGGTITNTITGTIDVTGTKEWVDNPDPSTESPHPLPQLTLHRQSAKQGAAEELVNTDAEDNPLEPGWSGATYTFANMPQYDAEGFEYTYWVTEEFVAGYLPPQYSDEDKALNGGTIINVQEPKGTLDIPAVKVLTGSTADTGASTRIEDWDFDISLYTGLNGGGQQIGTTQRVPAGTLSDDATSETSTVTFEDVAFRIINDGGIVKAQVKAADNTWVDMTQSPDDAHVYTIDLYAYETPITSGNTGLTQPSDGGTKFTVQVTNNNDSTLTVRIDPESVTAGDVLENYHDGTVLAEAVGESPQVVNKHEDTVDASIVIKKTLDGRDLQADDAFTFTATLDTTDAADDTAKARLASGVSSQSASTNMAAMSITPASGTDSSFATGNIALTFSKTGTYKFMVTESGTVAGVTNDAKATTGEVVTVTVTKDDATGELVPSVSYADGSEADFTNTYDATSDVTLMVRKLLNGESWNEDMNFWFTLEPETAPAGYDTTTMPKPTVAREAARLTNDPDTTHRAIWTFGEFTLADVDKEFVYKVVEDTPAFAGFDPSEWDLDITKPATPGYHTIKVVPQDNGDGTLKFNLYYDGATTAADQALTVTNRKKGTSRNIFASKEVVDGNGNPHWPTGIDPFELVLTGTGTGADKAPMPAQANIPSGATLDTNANTLTVPVSDPREVNFGTIEFDTAYQALQNGDEKTFTYTVTENTDPDNTHITYGVDNTSLFTVAITIKKENDGTVVDPHMVYYKGDAATGTVIYDSDQPDAPDSQYPVIKNKYEADGTLDLKLTKVLNGNTLTADAFNFTVYDSNGQPLYVDADGRLTTDAQAAPAGGGSPVDNTPLTASNIADGTVSFTQIKFTEADVASSPIHLVIREDIPVGAKAADDDALEYTANTTLVVRDAHTWVKDGITYDPAITHPVTVTLADPGTGTLDVTASSATDANPLTVTNTYTAQGTQNFQVYKYLDERPIKRAGFEFELKATGENAATTPMPGGAKGGTATTKVLPSAVYTHDGTASFGDIVYTMDDLKKQDGTYETSKTFTYEMREVPAGTQGSDGLTYADTVYQAEVTISNAGNNGTLSVTTVYTEKEGSGSAYGDNTDNAPDATLGDNGTVDFTNVYNADGTATLNSIKELLGREWQANDQFTFLIEPYEGGNIYSYTAGAMTPANKIDKANVPLPGNTIDPDNRAASGNSTGDGGNMNASGQYEAKVDKDGTAVGNRGRQAVIGDIKITDDMLSYDPADGILKGVFFYKITEDATGLADKGFTQQGTTTYYARVEVTDDRMGKLDFTTALYYTDPSKLDDPSAHQGATPVFENVYDAEVEDVTIPVVKFVDLGNSKDDLGWTNLADTDEFSFSAAPIGAGPGVTDGTIEIKKTTEDHKTEFTLSKISLDMLVYTTAAQGKQMDGTTDIAYSDGSTVAKGVNYAEFIGLVTENDLPASIKGVDKDETEVYVKLTAIDKLDGTIDTQYKFYSDVACTKPLVFERTAATNDIEFTNIYRNVMDVQVEKTWHDDGEDATIAARPNIKIQLTRQVEGGEEETLTTLDGNAKLFAAAQGAADPEEIAYTDGEAEVTAAQLPVTFTNLPATDKSGNAYIYNVIETSAGTGYYQSKIPQVTQVGALDDPETPDVDETQSRVIQLTNTKTTQVTVEKVWQDTDDTSKRGSVIVAALYENGILRPGNIQLVEDSADPAWTTTFETLPMYDDNDEAIEYTAKEMAVPAEYYTSLIEYSLTGEDDTWTTTLPENWNTTESKFVRITNILLTNVPTTKVWDGIPTDNAVYALYRTTAADPSAIEDGAWTPDNTWEQVMEADGTTPLTHTFTIDEFYEETASGAALKDPAKVDYTFAGLERYDKNGNAYTYRVLELTSGAYFNATQDTDTQVTNVNDYTSSGKATPNVVKELSGRDWADDDSFFFKIEPIKNIAWEGEGDERHLVAEDFDVDNDDPEIADAEAAAKAKVPLPSDNDDATDFDEIAVVAADDTQVGAIGRSVDFYPITYVSGAGSNAHVGEGQTANYFYKIYEVDKKAADAAPVAGTTSKGITYDAATHYLRVEVIDNGDGTITTNRYWDGSDSSSAVPVFTNTYKAAVEVHSHIIKTIDGRNYVESLDDEADSFVFKVVNLSGAVVRETEDGAATTDPTEATAATIGVADEEGTYVAKGTYVAAGDDGYTATGETEGNAKAIQSATSTWITSADLPNKTSDGKAMGTFIYELREAGIDEGSHANSGNLQFDESRIYMKVVVTDNLDGTLNVQKSYWRNAACTGEGNELTAKVRVDKATGNVAAADAEASTTEFVPAASFENAKTAYIEIDKQWRIIEDDTEELAEPVEPVTMNLRSFAAYIKDGKYYSDAACETEIQLPDDIDEWDPVHTHTFDRGDFYTATFVVEGEDVVLTQTQAANLVAEGAITQADFDAASWDLVGEAAYTFEDLPLYERDDRGNLTGRQYIYRVREASDSEAYSVQYSTDDEASWSSANSNDWASTTQNPADIAEAGGRVIVKNTDKATGTANIAAVKQLLGRDWLSTAPLDSTINLDRYTFTLTPLGKGTYDANGDLVSGTDNWVDVVGGKSGYQRIKDEALDTTDKAKKMPTSHVSTELDGVDNANTKALAADITHADGIGDEREIVGVGERLARFGSIAFTMDDLVYDPADGHMQGDFFYLMQEEIPVGAQAYNKATGAKVEGTTYAADTTPDVRATYLWKDANGITYDGTVHTVHVKVRENRTGNLVTQIAYDEKTPGDISTGTQFTPVFTNEYEAEGTQGADINKYIMGRTWAADETFTFEAQPLGGSPFFDENGVAIGDKATVVLTVSDTSKTFQEVALPPLHFALSDLPWTVGQDGAKDPRGIGTETTVAYSDGTTVPAGMKYGRFVYAIREASTSAADLKVDPDTEYIRVTVIDKGDGTLDTSYKVFEDRYCTVERKDAADDTKDATAATFVNQLKRNLAVTKNWTDAATNDVEFKLQWATEDPTDEASWYDAEGTPWLAGIDGTHTVAKEAEGAELTVDFANLPAYANTQDDIYNLNDKWVYYRIVETTTGAFETAYSQTAYQTGDTPSDYSATPLYTEAAGEEHITQLYVINFPEDLETSAKVFVVKQLIGNVWQDESFDFTITPIESKIGSETDFVPYGEGDGKRLMPLPNNGSDTTTTATADKTTKPVGSNEHNAEFDPIVIYLHDLALDTGDGVDKGEFVYEVAENIPGEAKATIDGVEVTYADATATGSTYTAEQIKAATWVDGDITYTTDTHRVTITATNTGNGAITTAVTWDGREVGDFVPVYVNEKAPDKEPVIDRVPVRLKWEDNNNQDGERPGSVTVRLLDSNGDPIYIDGEGNIVPAGTEGAVPYTTELSDENNWTASFDGVPVIDENGNPIEYLIAQDTPGGYTELIEPDGTGTFVITDTYTPGQTSITATKVWAGDADIDTSLRSDVVLHLYGTYDGAVVYDAGTQTIKLGATGEDAIARWDNVPLRHYNNENLTWEVVEEAVMGYATSYEWNENACVVTNTYTGPVTSITATKEWQDNDNRDNSRPDTIWFQLMRKVGDKTPEPVGDPVPLQPDSSGSWPDIEWNDLPISIKAETGTTTEQTHTELQDVEVTVYVNNEDETDEISVEEYEALTEDEQANYSETTKTVQEEVEVTEEVADVDELTVLYSVVELYDDTDLKTRKYAEPVVEAVSPGVFNIINKRDLDTTEITVQKIWNDEGNEGNRTDHVTVKVSSDGTPIHGEDTSVTRVITEEDGWKTVFTDLPLNKAGEVGTPIQYTVEEINIPGNYTPTYGGDGSAAAPLTITNTYNADPITVQANKVWVGDEGDTSTRSNVVLHLIQVINGAEKDMGAEFEKTIPANATGDALSVEWTGLPSFVDGKAVTYTVEEEAVDGYTTSYAKGDRTGNTISCTVTNTKIVPNTIVVRYYDPSTDSDIEYKEIVVGDREPDQPADPTREGYTFGGWQRTIDDDGNVVYIARWNEIPEPGKITVKYIDPVSGQEFVSKTITVGEEPEPEAPAENPTRDGYTFAGWKRFVDEDGNVTYEAQWIEVEETPALPKVVYTDPLNEGNAIILQSRKYADQNAADAEAKNKADAPTNPSHDGYEFVGWEVSKDEFGDYVLTAKYNAITPAEEKKIVSYVDPQSGKVIVSEFVDDPSEITPPNAPNYENMAFVGWELAQDANGNYIYMAKYAADCSNSTKTITETKIVKEKVPAESTPAAAYTPSATKPVTQQQPLMQSVGKSLAQTSDNVPAVLPGLCMLLVGLSLSLVRLATTRHRKIKE